VDARAASMRERNIAARERRGLGERWTRPARSQLAPWRSVLVVSAVDV